MSKQRVMQLRGLLILIEERLAEIAKLRKNATCNSEIHSYLDEIESLSTMKGNALDELEIIGDIEITLSDVNRELVNLKEQHDKLVAQYHEYNDDWKRYTRKKVGNLDQIKHNLNNTKFALDAVETNIAEVKALKKEITKDYRTVDSFENLMDQAAE